MIRYLFSAFLLSLCCVFQGYTQSCMFTRVVTAGGTGMETSRAIISDPAGNLYITGTYDSTCYFGNDSVRYVGDENIFLAKYNPSSGFLWAAAPIATMGAHAEAMAVDDQGAIYVTGYFYRMVNFGSGFAYVAEYVNTFLAKYSSSGSIIWAKSVAGDDNNPRSIACDGEGNVYLAGMFDGDLSYDTSAIHSNRTACYLLKIGRDGGVKWISHSEGTGTAYPKSVAVDPAGNVTYTGVFINPVSFGSVNLDGFGSYDVFICRLNATGSVVWAKQAGGSGDDQGASAICGNDGSVFINGYYENTASFGPFVLNTGGGSYSFDSFVGKMDGAGNFMWVKSINVASTSSNAMAIDAGNNIYLTGSFRGSAEVGPSVIWSLGYGDMFVLKMDQDGQILYAKSAGSTWIDDGQGVALLPSGDVAVTGILSSGATFDSIHVVNAANSIYIAFLHQHGPVAIDEINYRSADSLDAGDWTEIRNTGTKPVNLAGWTLKDGNDNNTFTVDSLTTIAPGQFLVFCQDTAKFRYIHPGIPNITGPFAFDLAANGEKVRLFDGRGLLIAQVRYYAVPPWPGMADGTGRTIELRNYQGELSDGNNWFPGCPGGSPGRRYQDCDSVGIVSHRPLVPSIRIAPNPVTDLLTVTFYSPDLQPVDLRIVDTMGRTLTEVMYADIKQGNNTLELRVNTLRPGVYLACLISGNNRTAGKFVKSK